MKILFVVLSVCFYANFALAQGQMDTKILKELGNWYEKQNTSMTVKLLDARTGQPVEQTLDAALVWKYLATMAVLDRLVTPTSGNQAGNFICARFNVRGFSQWFLDEILNEKNLEKPFIFVMQKGFPIEDLKNVRSVADLRSIESIKNTFRLISNTFLTKLTPAKRSALAKSKQIVEFQMRDQALSSGVVELQKYFYKNFMNDTRASYKRRFERNSASFFQLLITHLRPHIVNFEASKVEAVQEVEPSVEEKLEIDLPVAHAERPPVAQAPVLKRERGEGEEQKELQAPAFALVSSSPMKKVATVSVTNWDEFEDVVPMKQEPLWAVYDGRPDSSSLLHEGFEDKEYFDSDAFNLPPQDQKAQSLIDSELEKFLNE